MKFCFQSGWERLGGTRCLRRLARLLGGGIVLQVTAGGCQESFSNYTGALGQPIATGIGNSVSKLVEALILSMLI